MTDTTFRIVCGIPHVDDKAYPWAFEVNDNGDFPWHGFTLRLENGWEVHVQWRDRDGEPEFEPPATVASVDCHAVGLHDVLHHRDDRGSWPYGTPVNWSFPRHYIRSAERLDRLVRMASTCSFPTWLDRAA
jgi:hypothetical protein